MNENNSNLLADVIKAKMKETVQGERLLHDSDLVLLIDSIAYGVTGMMESLRDDLVQRLRAGLVGAGAQQRREDININTKLDDILAILRKK